MDFLKRIIEDHFTLILFFSFIFVVSLLAMIDSHSIRKHQIELQKNRSHKV